jgi:hypothetical protein
MPGETVAQEKHAVPQDCPCGRIRYRTTISSSHLVVERGESFWRFMCHGFLPMPSAAEKTLPFP